MFADSLLPAGRSRRGWTTLASFAMQAIGLTVLFVLPLLYTEGLPQVHLRDLLLTPPPAFVPAPAQPRVAPQRPLSTNLVDGRLVAPPEIPTHTAMIQDLTPAPEIPISGESTGVYQGEQAAMLSALSHEFSRVPPAAPKPVPTAKAPPLSRWMEGNLIRKIQPIYPAMGKSMGIQGTVLLRALISKDGKIEHIDVVSGHPLLVKAAMDAVSQWLYRPYYLNDQPIEVETQVTVNFILGR